MRNEFLAITNHQFLLARFRIYLNFDRFQALGSILLVRFQISLIGFVISFLFFF